MFTLQCVLSARFTVLHAQSVQLRFIMLRAQSMQHLKMRPARELALRGKFSSVVPRPLVDFGELARPIAVAVDTQVTCTEPAFNPIVRQSGIIVDAVRNLTGKRGVRKDFPENARRSVYDEYRYTRMFSDDDEARVPALFVKLMGSCESRFPGGIAFCTQACVCSWAQYARSPHKYDQALGSVAVLPSHMLAGVMAALDRMHTLGVAHNDVKPDNVLIDFTNGVLSFVLADFGLSGDSDHLDSARGTNGYRYLWSQSLDCHITGRHADFWAVGILCAEIMCGVTFLAPWDLTALGQLDTDQRILDDFVQQKLRAKSAEKMASPLRKVLVRNPGSRMHGLDPRQAHAAIMQVITFVSQQEQMGLIGPSSGKKRRREALNLPTGVLAPKPLTRAQKGHKRRDEAKRRWKQANQNP